MTKRTYGAGMACALVAALLAGCGGGGGATLPASGSLPTAQTVNVAYTFAFNNSVNQSSVRGRKYTSRATHGLTLYGETSTQDGVIHSLPTTLAGLRGPAAYATATTPGLVTNNVTCSTAAPSGAFNCTILIPTPPGYYDLEIATWDQAPATSGFGGSMSATANDLSTNILKTYRVGVNQVNSFNFTMNGVVASVQLAIQPNTLVSGANAQTAALSVLAKDADGNIIIGNDPYVNADGTPLTITLGIDLATETANLPSPLIGATPPPAGNLTFAPAAPGPASSATCLAGTPLTCTITSPLTQSLTVNYTSYENGTTPFLVSVSPNAVNPTPVIITHGTSLQFTNTTNGPVNVPGSPTITNVSLAALPPPGPIGDLHDITPGVNGDTNMYGTDWGSSAIVQIATPALSSPSLTTKWAIPSGETLPYGIVQGPDQNVYFAEYNNGNVGILNVATSQISETSGFSHPTDVAVGGDNNLYVANSTANNIKELKIVGIAFSNIANTYPVQATSGALSGTVQSIVAGPDGNLYAVEATKIARLVPGLAPAPVESGAVGTGMWNAAFGSDGNLYIADAAAKKIYQMPISGPSALTVTATWNTTYAPHKITLARDGDLYFTEWGADTNGSPNAVGRLSPGSPAQPVEFTNGVQLSGIYPPSAVSQTSAPYSIVQGSDNKMYFTYFQAPFLGYFAP